MAMKSYFIDDLRSPKNETTINKEQDCNINTEETTSLKNKILENRLLKDGVTDKQNFIDKILQHNSKLSQNFDVSRIILVTNEARKQPPERHYKENDKSIEKDRNVYVRRFSGAKVK